MKAIKILISSALVLLGQQMSLAQEFPIGVWFPGLFNNQPAHFATRLDQAVEANFNTIHAAQEGMRTDAMPKDKPSAVGRISCGSTPEGSRPPAR